MLSFTGAEGDLVSLSATNKAHFGFQAEKLKADKKGDDFATGFANALKDAFYNVNDLQMESEQLTRALAVRPDTVDIHDVTIAAEKARTALLFTKSIVDKITQAYRELINLR
jgi:flagellar hook-basal body complex protein FliE